MSRGLGPWGAFVALVATAGALGYVRQRVVDDHPGPPADAVAPLAIHARSTPANVRDQGRAALASDARRRAARFRDAANPGYLARQTRVAQHDLEAGRYSPDAMYQFGAQLFHLKFTPALGFGSKAQPALVRVHKGARGGPDALSCASCHRRGGPAGGGDAADNSFLDGDGMRPASALTRNPIALPGAGLVELLAREMTEDLQGLRDQAIAEAKRTGKAAKAELNTKGVAFGSLVAAPDGGIDASKVQGVDRDLVVKPFGWKGHAASLREVIEDELWIHHGMQTSHLAASGNKARIGDHEGVGPQLLPDPDGDGVDAEITEGQLSVLTLFVAMQETPQAGMPKADDVLALVDRGRRDFDKLGCASCHRVSLPLRSTVFELPSRDGGAPIRVDLAKHGASPRLRKNARGGYEVFVHSDLKRHLMGKRLTESRRYRGVVPAAFITRPLWGMARSRPYMHDARAPEMMAAILAHDGEGRAAAEAFEKLPEHERAPLRVYLTTLTRKRRLVTQ